jgi:D-serine dehydratase
MTELQNRDSVWSKLRKAQPQLWLNPELQPAAESLERLPLTRDDLQAAQARWQRFAPLLAGIFPDVGASSGTIASALVRVSKMQHVLKAGYRAGVDGALWVKADHDLPVAGSIKARGGIYEVLCLAERLVLAAGLMTPRDNYAGFNDPKVKGYLGRYTVAVGSTGNLGLSVGTMASALGFKAVVHMSTEAAPWKKRLLRAKGVVIVEHQADYTAAVAAGRQQAAQDPLTHFVDDENSQSLFLGYSCAALELQRQLDAAGIVINERQPLFVYLPCGVGGAPGGITFGLKHVFGDAVHCFLAEPVQSPCMLLGLITGFQDNLSVYDIGLKNDSAADGLTVGRASRLVGALIKHLVAGVYTVTDRMLFRHLYWLDRSEGLRIEPSAAAGFAGPLFLTASPDGSNYLKQAGLQAHRQNVRHLVWTTGGKLVPASVYEAFWRRGADHA